MAAIESKNLLTVLKCNARAKKLPLDYTEVWDSLAEAQAYLNNPTAYAGQTVKVLVNGEYHTYTLQPGEGDTLVLKENSNLQLGDIQPDLYILTALPSSGVQNVLYINTTDSTGSIWDGEKFVTVFENVLSKTADLKNELMAEIETKAPIDSPVFTGTVTLAADPNADMEAVTKRYVDTLVATLEDNAVPGIVNSTNPIPADYKAGLMYRVSEAGTYAGQECEVGDLILVTKDYNAETASDDDFIVLQANIDGAVTGPESAIDLDIAIFDGATGKVIKDSGVTIASLNDAIAKAHTHANKTVLDSYDKTQTELLGEVDTKISTAKGELQDAIDKKADKATTLEGYGITDAYTKTEVDNLLTPITTNLNTKLDRAAVEEIANDAKDEAISTAATNAQNALEARIGDIAEDVTVKAYVDSSISTTTTSFEEQIATAKSEAITESKNYADSLNQVTLF